MSKHEIGPKDAGVVTTDDRAASRSVSYDRSITTSKARSPQSASGAPSFGYQYFALRLSSRSLRFYNMPHKMWVASTLELLRVAFFCLSLKGLVFVIAALGCSRRAC